jgi:hypothetical protein
LVGGSIDALETYFDECKRMYGWDGVAVSAADRELPEHSPILRSESFKKLVEQAVTAMCGKADA